VKPAPHRSREPDFEELRFYLSRLRRTRGWTYEDLAEHSGLGRRSLIQVENGHSHGSIETWYKLAEALDVDIGALLSALYGPTRSRS